MAKWVNAWTRKQDASQRFRVRDRIVLIFITFLLQLIIISMLSYCLICNIYPRKECSIYFLFGGGGNVY